MKYISTGEPSTLKTYRKIALFLNNSNEESIGVKFIDGKIKESPLGEDEEVLADESQMIHFIMSMVIQQNSLGNNKET